MQISQKRYLKILYITNYSGERFYEWAICPDLLKTMINEYYMTGPLRSCSRIRSLSFPCSSCSTRRTSAGDSDASP